MLAFTAATAETPLESDSDNINVTDVSSGFPVQCTAQRNTPLQKGLLYNSETTSSPEKEQMLHGLTHTASTNHKVADCVMKKQAMKT